MSHFSGFVRNVCDKCNLFCPDKEADSELHKSEPLIKLCKVKHHRLEDLPKSHVEDTLEEPVFAWDAPHFRFVIVSDCKPLVQIINGVSPLASPSMLPFSIELRITWQHCLKMVCSPIACSRTWSYGKDVSTTTNQISWYSKQWTRDNLGIRSARCLFQIYA